MTVLSTIKNTIRNFIAPKAVILMYHQICERKSDPWQLAVTPEKFDEQLEMIKKDFEVVSVDEMVLAIKSRKLHNRMLSITFDDGFADNYINAKPRLKASSLPATFYCTTHTPNHREIFWWEELESLILQTETLPRSIDIKIGDEAVKFQFNRDAILTESLKNQIELWNAELPACNERTQLFFNLWKTIQPLGFDDQRQAVDHLKSWAGVSKQSKCSAVMTVDQIAEMAKDPLFTIGGHTVHHVMLGAQEVESQAYEVRECKSVLENWVNTSVTGFAYPYGNYNSTTKILLRDAGFRYALSTESRTVSESDDLFNLPRVQVKNWNKKEFEINLHKIAAL
jgi:peptidoglycan/xylan/chitin deacetylase (PgdA/CDA1 family)